jgi:alkanesulfonate monooxygenase SsuD/methylene tetrahydromethanopterin reductase-like flavin-dependent oxidoreductase (luciferase family)
MLSEAGCGPPVQAIVKRAVSAVGDNGVDIAASAGGDPMRLGVALAQAGCLADPASVRSAAAGAEQVGYSSIWVVDRVSDPDAVLDPITVLAYAAAVTDRVRLGTSVLVAPWYQPVLLARSLASLDLLSDGRLTIGLGLGASPEEYKAVGVPHAERGRRLEETLDVLDAAWTAAPESRDRPPVLLAGMSADGLDRVARRADGWNPQGVPVDRLGGLWTTVRHLAASHGRDPDALELVVRANVTLSDEPLAAGRPSYHGTVDQVADDLRATRAAGAHEVILGLDGDHCLHEVLEYFAALAEATDLTE